MRHNCVPAPWSIYKGMKKLPPATLLTLDSANTRQLHPVQYWSMVEEAEHGLAHPWEGSPVEMVEELDAELRRSIEAKLGRAPIPDVSIRCR